MSDVTRIEYFSSDRGPPNIDGVLRGIKSGLAEDLQRVEGEQKVRSSSVEELRRVNTGKEVEHRLDQVRDQLVTTIHKSKDQKVVVKITLRGNKMINRPLKNSQDLLGKFGVVAGPGSDTAGRQATQEAVFNDIVVNLYGISVELMDFGPMGEWRGEFFNGVITDECERGLRECGIDLRDYQIYSDRSLRFGLLSNPEAVLKHCLWNTLTRVLCRFDDGGQKALQCLSNASFCTEAAKKRVLVQVAELYKTKIRLTFLSKTGARQMKVYGKGGEEIKIGLINDHYFPNVILEPKTKAGGPVDLHNLIKQKALGTEKHENVAKGSYSFRTRYKKGLPQISSFALINQIVKAGYVEPIDPSLVYEFRLSKLFRAVKPDFDTISPESENMVKRITDEMAVDSDPPVTEKKSCDCVWYADFETVTVKSGAQVRDFVSSRGGKEQVSASDCFNLAQFDRKGGNEYNPGGIKRKLLDVIGGLSIQMVENKRAVAVSAFVAIIIFNIYLFHLNSFLFV